MTAPAQHKKILFATIAAGGSHVSSAQAMKEALEARYPERFGLELYEPMKAYGFEALDTRHKESWRWALAHPWTVVWGQRVIDSVPRVSVAFHRRMLRPFAARAAEVLRKDPPALIVVNHGWLTVAFTMSQRHFGLDVPVLTFQTSTLDVTALWADPDAERFLVGSPVAKSGLVKLGVSGDKIDVVGYPVRRSFLEAPGKTQARAALGLQDTFTCLVSLGGEGVGGNPVEVVAALRTLPHVQVVVIAGRNEALKEALEPWSADPLVRVEGFVDNMADFVAACDLVIGKTGPAAVFEALAVGRPVLATRRSGGVENLFIRFLETKGLGRYTPTTDTLLETVRAYQASPETLDDVAARAAALDFPGMSARVADYLAHYALTGEPDLSLRGEGVVWT